MFSYKKQQLHVEDVSLVAIAEAFSTPCYVYSKAAIVSQWQAFSDVLKRSRHLICYSVKANSNLAILNLLARLGSGFDIVSVGELERVIKAGGSPGKTVFSGVGKRTDEIKRALEVGIKCFNVESFSELEKINCVAMAENKKAPVSFRINPDIDAKTHQYIATGLKENKFGIAFHEAVDNYLRASEMPGINIIGIDCHIGSQIMNITPFKDALLRIRSLVDELHKRGIHLQHIDIGGGFAIDYQDEQAAPKPQEYLDAIQPLTSDYEWIIEPGRAIVGNAGILLMRVEYLKHGQKNFAVVDAGMNDLLRPALYQSYHQILPITKPFGAEGRFYDIVGPICESADCFAHACNLALFQGDLLAVMSAGAYGFSMSSQYNARPRPTEVLVSAGKAFRIRKKEQLAQLWEGESLPPLDI